MRMRKPSAQASCWLHTASGPVVSAAAAAVRTARSRPCRLRRCRRDGCRDLVGGALGPLRELIALDIEGATPTAGIILTVSLPHYITKNTTYPSTATQTPTVRAIRCLAHHSTHAGLDQTTDHRHALLRQMDLHVYASTMRPPR